MKIFFILFILLKGNLAHSQDENRSVNFRIDGAGLFVGKYQLSADFKATPNLTLGPFIEHWKLRPLSATESEWKTLSYGIRIEMSSKGALSNGFYFGLFIKNYALKALSATGSFQKKSGLPIGFIGGYQRFFGGFNAKLALTYAMMQEPTVILDGVTEAPPIQLNSILVEFTLGYAF